METKDELIDRFVGKWIPYRRKEIKAELVKLIEKVCQLEPRVIPQGELEECPLCTVGHNSKGLGGNDRCFHCDTCGWAACIIDVPKDGLGYTTGHAIKSHLEDVEERLKNYYAKRASSEPQSA